MKPLFPFTILLPLLIFAALASAQTPCLTNADKATPTCDGMVSLSEISAHIQAWYAYSSCIPDLFNAIQAYYAASPSAGTTAAMRAGARTAYPAIRTAAAELVTNAWAGAVPLALPVAAVQGISAGTGVVLSKQLSRWITRHTGSLIVKREA